MHFRTVTHSQVWYLAIELLKLSSNLHYLLNRLWREIVLKREHIQLDDTIGTSRNIGMCVVWCWSALRSSADDNENRSHYNVVEWHLLLYKYIYHLIERNFILIIVEYYNTTFQMKISISAAICLYTHTKQQEQFRFVPFLPLLEDKTNKM